MSDLTESKQPKAMVIMSLSPLRFAQTFSPQALVSPQNVPTAGALFGNSVGDYISFSGGSAALEKHAAATTRRSRPTMSADMIKQTADDVYQFLSSKQPSGEAFKKEFSESYQNLSALFLLSNPDNRSFDALLSKLQELMKTISSPLEESAEPQAKTKPPNLILSLRLIGSSLTEDGHKFISAFLKNCYQPQWEAQMEELHMNLLAPPSFDTLPGQFLYWIASGDCDIPSNKLFKGYRSLWTSVEARYTELQSLLAASSPPKQVRDRLEKDGFLHPDWADIDESTLHKVKAKFSI